ncbi:MAG: family 10 glycosylhydrolase [Armatimonadota bacterium]|nr:family 10 glycosylhydrolase [Armatimonadota bacterium]
MLLVLLLLAPAVLRADVAAPNGSELRAFWVDGFNDGFKTPQQCDLLLARLRAGHCNAVFVQMRKRADAYYASHYEGWAMDDPQQFDALEYLCRKGHEKGQPRLQIHAWINACAVGGNPSAGSLAKVHPDWLSLSDKGEDFDGEATKIDPGNPAAADWTCRVYLDIVRHYDVDGIHLDFIRYGGDDKNVGHWGYNAVSVARFNRRYGTIGQPAWDDPKWQAWRRNQVTALVRRVYVQATALKPHLVVSAATIAWGNAPVDDKEYETRSASYTQVFAPWRDWLREGILDLNCPMTYFTLPKNASKWEGWSQFVKDHQYDRMAVMGCGIWLNTLPNSYALIRSTREPSVQGHRTSGVVLYCYDGTDTENGKEMENNPALYAGLSQPGIFEQDVPPPSLPWKDHPTTGAVMGTLLSKDGLTPLDGAVVTIQNERGTVKRTATTDGNGFWAATRLPPGAYRVTRPLARRFFVGAGQTAVLNGARSRVFGLGSRPTGTKVVLTDVLVTSGSDRLGDYFCIADGFGYPALRVAAPGLVPPTVMGDKVAISGTIEQTPAGAVLKAKAVRFLGARLIEAR